MEKKREKEKKEERKSEKMEEIKIWRANISSTFTPHLKPIHILLLFRDPSSSQLHLGFFSPSSSSVSSLSLFLPSEKKLVLV